MVNKCCVVNCNTNYALKLQIHQFPSHAKNPEKRALWIAKVPRADWKPSKDADLWICQNHFRESDYVTESKDSNSRRKRKRNIATLPRRRLKDDVYPSVWPGSPEYLTKPPVPPRPTVFSSSESRRLNEEFLRSEEITRDQFHSIEELVAKLDKSRFPEGVTEILTKNYICFINVCIIDKPKVVYSFKITNDLQFRVWYDGE